MNNDYLEQRRLQKLGIAKTSAQEKADNKKMKVVIVVSSPAKKKAPAKKKIARNSKKRKKENSVYDKERKIFLAANPICQAQIVDTCRGEANQVHHKRKKRSKDDRINPDNFLAVCGPCHLFIEAHPKKAMELGLSEKGVD